MPLPRAYQPFTLRPFRVSAQAARAAYLVTGNLKHLPATSLDTRVVTGRHFLEIMAGEAERESRRDDH